MYAIVLFKNIVLFIVSIVFLLVLLIVQIFFKRDLNNNTNTNNINTNNTTMQERDRLPFVYDKDGKIIDDLSNS